MISNRDIWLFSLCLFGLLNYPVLRASLIGCPSQCVCFSTTVRCMFLQLDRIPKVPAQTTILDLRFNNITHLPPNGLRDYSKLTTLLLNDNRIKSIVSGSFNGLHNLRYLYLYKNKIKSIDKDAFQGMKNLEQLYLHFNDINELHPDTFSHLPSLERLFLHNNKLTSVPYGTFRNMTSLHRLRLDSNALVCDCKMLWLANMLKEQGMKNTVASCKYPKVLQGKSIISLSQSELKCKKPVLMEEPNDVDLVFGGTVYFSCKADGDPSPDIFWLHDNNEIDPLKAETSRYSVLQDGTLMIENAQETDQGVYECMAKNSLGEVRSRKAKMKRQIRENYQDTRQSLNTFNNNIELSSPNLNNIYSNRVSDVSRAHFTAVPRKQVVIKGSEISLQCLVSGNPPPKVEWRRNGNPITDTFRTVVSEEVNNRITISDAQAEDAGLYQCVASDSHNTIMSSVEITIQEPPIVLEAPVDQVVELGGEAIFYCQVDGDPPPTVTWIRRGRVLTPDSRITISHGGSRVLIRNVSRIDQTTYLCRAQNVAGTRDAGADLIIKERGPPSFTVRPQSLVVQIGDTAQFHCAVSGHPTPTIRWLLDGVPLSNSITYSINSAGTLTIRDVSHVSQGLYECRAENELGLIRTTAYMTVRSRNQFGVSDTQIQRSVSHARQTIDRAINSTMHRLLDTKKHPQGPADIQRLIRFPSPEVLNTVRAAEIYERAISYVRHHVREGHTFNFTNDFSPIDIELSAENLQLMANLSGCLIHRRHLNCSDWCFHSKYRTYDGTCNNLQHSMWGASEIGLRRILRPIYENGFNTPVGWTAKKLYNGFELPSARLISSTIITAHKITEDDTFTHMLMQWGQFLDHDLDLAPPTVSTESFVEGTNCQFTCENAPPCFPIIVPDDDERIRTRRCMEFVRTSAICGSGATSVLYGQVQPRDQLNVLTSYIDGSQVYGSSEAEALHLRVKGSDSKGLLRAGIATTSGKLLLPFNDHWPVDCRRNPRESGVDCFLAGDIRVNEQLALIAMHTVWFREHNRLAEELSKINPQWNGDRLYQEARKIVGAKLQHITYEHWLPKILGPKGMEMLGPYKGYDPLVDATISNEFATAALRFGHTLINPILKRLGPDLQPIRHGHIHLRNAFFSPFRILHEGGIDPLLRGLFAIPAKLKVPDQLVNRELTEQLFRQVHHVPLDLAAINIQRGRDHGLPSYNKYRKWCNLTEVETFDQLISEIKNKTLRDKLQNVYKHPGNIDLWVGGVSEDVVKGAKVGPTFLCILVEQFRRLRDGDRFYYENPGVFKPEQLAQLKQSTLAQIICDNGDAIENITTDVFTLPEKNSNSGLIRCEAIAREDLHPWVECCQSCRSDEQLFRSRRHADIYSYSANQPESGGGVSTVLHKNQSEESTYLKKLNSVDVDIDEERIEGLETLVEKLTLEVSNLKRLILMKDNTTVSGCTDRQGNERKEGEIWMTNKCTECVCEVHQITCKVNSECILNEAEE